MMVVVTMAMMTMTTTMMLFSGALLVSLVTALQRAAQTQHLLLVSL